MNEFFLLLGRVSYYKYFVDIDLRYTIYIYRDPYQVIKKIKNRVVCLTVRLLCHRHESFDTFRAINPLHIFNDKRLTDHSATPGRNHKTRSL